MSTQPQRYVENFTSRHASPGSPKMAVHYRTAVYTRTMAIGSGLIAAIGMVLVFTGYAIGFNPLSGIGGSALALLVWYVVALSAMRVWVIFGLQHRLDRRYQSGMFPSAGWMVVGEDQQFRFYRGRPMCYWRVTEVPGVLAPDSAGPTLYSDEDPVVIHKDSSLGGQYFNATLNLSPSVAVPVRIDHAAGELGEINAVFASANWKVKNAKHSD